MEQNKNKKNETYTPDYSELLIKQGKSLFPYPQEPIEELVNILLEENKQLKKQVDSLIKIVSRQLNAPPF